MRLLLIFFLIFLTTSCVHKKPIPDLVDKKCGRYYCYYSSGANPTKTLIYFPGLLDGKKSLESGIFDTADVNDLIQALSPVKVLVISKATLQEPAWFVKDKNEIKNLITSLEKQFQLPKPFLAVGHSMGGANLGTLAAMNPALFNKIALVSPMIIPSGEDPFTKFSGPALLIKNNYTKAEWMTLKPQTLVINSHTYPSTLVTACKKDLFGLYPGAVSFYGVVKAKLYTVSFFDQLDGCSHVSFPTKQIVEFLK